MSETCMRANRNILQIQDGKLVMFQRCSNTGPFLFIPSALRNNRPLLTDITVFTFTEFDGNQFAWTINNTAPCLGV